MKRWHVCTVVRNSIYGQPRIYVVITDGYKEVDYEWGIRLAKFKAWRLNRADGYLPGIEQVRAERKRYDDALREVDAR